MVLKIWSYFIFTDIHVESHMCDTKISKVNPRKIAYPCKKFHKNEIRFLIMHWTFIRYYQIKPRSGSWENTNGRSIPGSHTQPFTVRTEQKESTSFSSAQNGYRSQSQNGHPPHGWNWERERPQILNRYTVTAHSYRKMKI